MAPYSPQMSQLGFFWHVCTLTALYWLIPVIQYLWPILKDSIHLFLGKTASNLDQNSLTMNILTKYDSQVQSSIHKHTFVDHLDVDETFLTGFFWHNLNVDSIIGKIWSAKISISFLSKIEILNISLAMFYVLRWCNCLVIQRA